MKRLSLSGNALKLFAMVAMTCDHVGLQLLPQVPLLRMIGRLALPVYAFLIAEGCRHTRSFPRYLARMAAMAALCQVVYLVAMGSLYMCILVTFSLSISLIWAWKSGKPLLAAAVTALAFFLCVVLPDLVPGFEIDYGLPGVLLPVLIYFGKPMPVFLCAGLALLGLSLGGNQWLAFAAVPVILLYNGERGKRNLGRFFYWYYPLHLAVIYLLSLIL
jgi:hypothetical protein